MKIAPSDPTVIALCQHQGNMSDAAFAKRHLSVSPTTWFRIRTGDYQADDHSAVYTKICSDLRAIEEHLLITQGRNHEILPLEHIELSLQALRMAFAESRNRLVVILAETGGGKTTITRAIEQEFPSRAVRTEATEPWRQSYLAGIHAVGEACGLSDLPNNARAAESRLIKELVARPRIIIIDEGNYFGPATLNLVKAILNLTGSHVVITSLPLLWDRMKQNAWQETRQLRNRTAALLEFKTVTTGDVRTVLRSRLPNWESLGAQERTAVNLVRDAANSFGLWNTVSSIADALSDATGSPLAIDQVERAITEIKTLRR